MHLVRTFCSSIAKTSTVTTIFYFVVLIRTVLPFDEKKIGTNLCSFVWQFFLNCTDWAITGRIACVQFKSTLEGKIKTRALKGIFLVRKWINNTFKSNSVRYHMHHQKKSLLFVYFWAARGFCQRVLNSSICQHCDVKTSKVTAPFLFLFYHLLDLLHQCPENSRSQIVFRTDIFQKLSLGPLNIRRIWPQTARA